MDNEITIVRGNIDYYRKKLKKFTNNIKIEDNSAI